MSQKPVVFFTASCFLIHNSYPFPIQNSTLKIKNYQSVRSIPTPLTYYPIFGYNINMNVVMINLNLIDIACVIAIFQALLMAVFFFTSKKGRKQSNIILGFWLLSFAIILTSYFLVSYWVWQYFLNYHKSIFVLSQFSLLIGPLLYFYTLSLLDEKFRFRKRDLIHLLPFVILTFYLMVRFIFISDFTIIESFSDFLCNGLFLVQNLFYYILILKLLKLHELSIKTFFANKRDLKYNWIRFLMIGSFVIWIAKLQSFLFWLKPVNPSWCCYTSTACFLAAFLFVNSIVYISLKIPNLFLFNKKYVYSSLSETDKLNLKTQLLKYMNEEKLYLDPNLNLETLAKKISVTREHLSQIINEMCNQNFYDFVNQYRVKECIGCLKDGNNGKKTLLRIALECGFSSKATFNSAFKKFTGVTPKEFRNGNFSFKEELIKR